MLFIGPPGVGKTMLAVGLGHPAVAAGYRVYYTTAGDLAARCHRAAIEGRWATTMRFFAGPRLLIMDEVGYLPLQAKAPPRCSRSSPSATSRARSSSPPTGASPPGERSSTTRGRRGDARPAAPPRRRGEYHRRVVPDAARRARAGKLRAGDGTP